MNNATLLNQEVEITSVYFPSKAGTQREVEGYPRRMVFEGREYNFMESGIRYLVRKGQELVRLFDVSDGQQTYRLRLDNQNHWTLVAMKDAVA